MINLKVTTTSTATGTLASDDVQRKIPEKQVRIELVMQVKIRYPSGSTMKITCDDAHEPVGDEHGISVDLVIDGKIETIDGIESMEVLNG